MPEEAASAVTERLTIPTIGIGAGRNTDGQVLVVNDLLGINDFEFKHSKRFTDFDSFAREAIRRYAENVTMGHFPAKEHVRHLKEAEQVAFASHLADFQA